MPTQSAQLSSLVYFIRPVGLGHSTRSRSSAKLITFPRRTVTHIIGPTETKKNGRDKVEHSRSLPGCETLCSSVEQWYTSTIELLKAQEFLQNDGDSSQEKENTPLQTLEEEWSEVRANMRLRGQDGAHCFVYFADKVEYCRGVVSGEIVQAAELEAAILPVCRRYLHMAKEYETDAVQCFKGS